MTDLDQADEPRLTVAGTGLDDNLAGGVWTAVSDGSAAIASGCILAGGFGIEVLKSMMSGDAAERWWYLLGSAAGIGLVLLGFWLRSRARRLVRVGVVVTAADARRGVARARQLDQQAETFSRKNCAVTMKVHTELSGDGARDRTLIERLADETLTAVMLAERLTPDAARINVIPTMPLNAGFWFGARLGHTHARELSVHAIRQSDGAPPYFPATVLRTLESRTAPLVVDPLQTIGGDPSKVALALDLQGFDDQFLEQVKAACHTHDIGYLLVLRSGSTRLREDKKTFTGIVEQTCTAWRRAPLTAQARTGDHAIFLNGPLAISVALGARLAAPETDRWTAFTFDSGTGQYEPFPTR